MPVQYRILLPMIAFFVLFASCKKDTTDNDCEKLKNAIVSNNAEDIKSAVTQFINQLASKNNSKENLENLAATLSNKCSLTANLLCFGCIQTLPEQSEIRISILSGSTQLSKTIDISYSPDGLMKIVGVHE
jgi:hypothetical protein